MTLERGFMVFYVINEAIPFTRFLIFSLFFPFYSYYTSVFYFIEVLF